MKKPLTERAWCVVYVWGSLNARLSLSEGYGGTDGSNVSCILYRSLISST